MIQIYKSGVSSMHYLQILLSVLIRAWWWWWRWWRWTPLDDRLLLSCNGNWLHLCVRIPWRRCWPWSAGARFNRTLFLYLCRILELLPVLGKWLEFWLEIADTWENWGKIIVFTCKQNQKGISSHFQAEPRANFFCYWIGPLLFCETRTSGLDLWISAGSLSSSPSDPLLVELTAVCCITGSSMRCFTETSALKWR